MAGIGSAWGSREEMLHPRDRHGRFRKKWKMAASVVDALSSFLDRFQPHQFQSDQQASQYAFNNRKAPWSTPELQRLHTDWDDANEALQAGEMDDTTKKFVAMMDRNMVETTDDLIVSQTVPTTAFGLSPQQAAMEDGGLEDLIGLEIADAGYSATNLGSELSHPPGSVTLRVAVPKGTRVAYGGRTPNDRSLIFDRDQPLVVTKVESDGRGGWYMLAIAGSGARTKGAAAVADDRTHGRRGAGLTPEQREARVVPRMSEATRGQIAQQEQQQNEAATLAHQRQVQGQPPPPSETPVPAPTPQAPAPAAPASPQTPAPPAAGVPERQEPVLKDAVGPGSPEGKSASDIAQEAEAAKVQAENAPPPPPAPPSPADFRAATADIPSPAAGKRRAQWNKAHQGVVTGKRDPQDVLRELDTDIQVARGSQERIKRGEDPPDPNLDSDLDSMEKLADAISQHSGAPRRGQQAPSARPVAEPSAGVPSGPKATPGAPSTKKAATPKAPAPKKAAKRAPADIAKDINAATTREEAEAHLEGMTGPELTALADHMEAPHAKRATKEQLRRAILHRKGRELDGEAIRNSSTRQRQEAGALTDGQKARIVDRAKQFRGKERNDDERRIVAMADEIEAGGEGDVAAKKFLDKQQGMEKRLSGTETRSEMRKRTAGPGLTDEQKADIKAKADRTNDRVAKEQADYDTKNKADLDSLLESAGLQEDDLDELDKTGASLILGQVREKKISKTEGVRRLKGSKSERLQKLGDALGAQPRKATPAKAVAKKAAPAKAAPSPVDDAEEAFKARVAEAGLPDRVTALRDMARAQKIRGFSTMNKRQLQSALLGDEVPRATKIGVVPPAKMVPHLEAAKSDQEARALLAKHTLTDLKDLANHRDMEFPKRITKARLQDMVLEDIRGPQESIQGRTPDTGLPEDLGQMGYITLPGPNGEAISKEIAQTVPDDPDALRRHRDNLEALSKQFRADGDKNAANMAQAAADAMGMRAQTISGVEEATPPVKRVAKKAVPEVPEGEVPETERPIEKMLKPELLALAQKEGASAVRPSWSKAKILDEIKRNRRMDSSRGPETEEQRLRRELGQLPGGPERDLGPNQGPLRLPDRAPTPEEIARDAGEVPAPAKKATKKAAKKAAVDVEKAAANIGEQVRGVRSGTGETFGDQLKNLDVEEFRRSAREQGVELADGNTAEEIFDNTVKKALTDRMRELGMLPEEKATPTKATKRVPKGSVAGPKADVPIETNDRRASFNEAWDGQGLTAPGAAGRSLEEVRGDIASGKLTPEEGVRRIESDIAFNKEDLATLDAEYRGLGAAGDRSQRAEVARQRRELRDGIKAQEKASSFIRDHFKNEAPVTREELEVKLDGPEKAALQRVEVDDLKAAAKAEGLGDIEGDDKDTVVANIGKAMQRRELANQEKEQKARDLQARKDVVRQHAEAISGIEQVMGGSDRAVQARIRSQSTASKLSPELRQELLDNAGDRAALQGVLDRVARENGLRRIDTRGQETHFDPERHDLPPGSGIQKGDPVTVLEPGFRSDVEGHDVQVKKAKVTEGHGGVPSGEPTGVSTPAQAPVQAAPGTAAGRITTSRLTPGTRIMVQRGQTEGLVTPTTRKTGAIPVTVTKIEGARVGGRRRGEYQVTVKDDDGNELSLGVRPGAQTHMLEPPPKAPKATKKAAQAARDEESASGLRTLAEGGNLEGPISGKPARRDTQDLLGELVNDENPMSREEVGARIADLDRAQLQEMAKALGIPAGSRRTIPDTRRSIVEATVGRRLDSIATRGFRGDRPGAPEPDLPEGAPARVLAESHKVTSTPLRSTPKVVDLDNPTRHNAEVIGTGLDLEPKGADRDWLGIVQRDLDRGTDGRQIANDLRREADSQRTIHNIQEAIAPGTGGPAGRIDRMERMADRLEGVRPIEAPAPAKAAPSGPGKREMGTMAAATAQSTALRDLKNGKSHAEVATALRQAATSVGSKDHDPQFVRPLEFSPAERSAMKRSDAKALRELASQIQAEGVAQRAAAKAAKKAPAKSHLRPDTGAAIFSDDPKIRAQAEEAFKAREVAKKAPAKKAAMDFSPEAAKAMADVLSNPENISPPKPKKRTAAEMRRAQALAGPDYPLEQVLADWDRQKEERKNLTGPVGEMIAAQMDDAMRRLQEADSPAAEDSALAGLLHPELKQLAIKLGLPPGGLKSEVARRIKDRVKGREAPGTSAERAVPTPGGVDESVPMQPYSKTDNMRMHVDSPTMHLVRAYEAAGRNGSANKMLDLRRRATESGGSTTPQQVVDELKAMRAVETDPKIQRELDHAIAANDAPMTPMPDLPPNTPPAARDLVERLHAIPYARKPAGSTAAMGTTSKEPLEQQVAQVLRELASGESRQQPEMLLRRILSQQVHEMNEPAFRIVELARLLEPVTDAQGRRLPSPLVKALREMRGGGTGKA